MAIDMYAHVAASVQRHSLTYILIFTINGGYQVMGDN